MRPSCTTPYTSVGDRQLDAVARAELEHHARGRHALGHHVHLVDDLGDLAAAAELLAHPAVAALRRDARGDQVAHAGEPRERLRLAAHRHAEPRDLGEPARDHGRARVVADAEPVAHARGDRDHVLERAAELAADHVGVRVDAEQAGVEHALHLARDALVVDRDHARGGEAGHDLAREVRARERGREVIGDHVLDHLVMRSMVSRSRPFARLTIGTHGRSDFFTSASTARRQCEGTPITTRSASRTACSTESVA